MKKGVKYFLLLLGAAAILVSGVTLFITNRQFKLDRYSARNFTAISVDELKNDGRVTFDRSLMLVNGEHSLPGTSLRRSLNSRIPRHILTNAFCRASRCCVRRSTINSVKSCL